jgi:hypothetical protein
LEGISFLRPTPNQQKGTMLNFLGMDEFQSTQTLTQTYQSTVSSYNSLAQAGFH